MQSIDYLCSFGTDYLEVSVIQRYSIQIRMRSSVNRTPFGVASLGGVLRAVWESPLKSGDPPSTHHCHFGACLVCSEQGYGIGGTVHVKLRNGPEITSLADAGPDASYAHYGPSVVDELG